MQRNSLALGVAIDYAKGKVELARRSFASRLPISTLDDASYPRGVPSRQQGNSRRSKRSISMRISVWQACFCALAALSFSLSAAAAPSAGKPTGKQPAEVVELFAGMESGAIEVKVFPKDATKGTVTIKNNTDKPLTIKVPAALAGVPVLGQGALGGCGGGLGGCGGGGGGGNQGFGGGMMGGMGGMGGMMGGMGGGMFNIAPERVAKVKLVTVCLDHGKDDPNPHVEYTLVPIESYAKDPAVTEVIKLMLSGKLDQHSAQAAAWNLQNGLSWQELAKKVGAKHLNGSVEPYFTAVQLQRALVATQLAQKQAKQQSERQTKEASPGTEAAGQ
jgi:hypothetical protein